jgi:hypothetical protein
MSLNTARSLNTLAVKVAAITGMQRVYSCALTEADVAAGTYSGVSPLPGALSGEFPCAIVEPGDTTEYVVNAGILHRHTYEARVQIIAGAFGGDIGARAAQVLAYADTLIEQFAVAAGILLSGAAESCTMLRRTGLVAISYGGAEYTGIQFTLSISESATPTGGS